MYDLGGGKQKHVKSFGNIKRLHSHKYQHTRSGKHGSSSVSLILRHNIKTFKNPVLCTQHCFTMERQLSENRRRHQLYIFHSAHNSQHDVIHSLAHTSKTVYPVSVRCQPLCQGLWIYPLTRQMSVLLIQSLHIESVNKERKKQ